MTSNSFGRYIKGIKQQAKKKIGTTNRLEASPHASTDKIETAIA